MTIRPDFFSDSPEFWRPVLGKLPEVFWDAELSQIPNSVPILSRFECNVASHVAVDHF